MPRRKPFFAPLTHARRNPLPKTLTHKGKTYTAPGAIAKIVDGLKQAEDARADITYKAEKEANKRQHWHDHFAKMHEREAKKNIGSVPRDGTCIPPDLWRMEARCAKFMASVEDAKARGEL